MKEMLRNKIALLKRSTNLLPAIFFIHQKRFYKNLEFNFIDKIYEIRIKT